MDRHCAALRAVRACEYILAAGKMLAHSRARLHKVKVLLGLSGLLVLLEVFNKDNRIIKGVNRVIGNFRSIRRGYNGH